MARNTVTGSREGFDKVIGRYQNRNAVSPRRRRIRACRRERGFTYLAVLVLVVLMGIALASAGEVWHTTQQREKEQELLFIGHQFRLALKRYADHTPGKSRRAPLHLEELLKDPRHPDIRRYLRKIYPDPVTGRPEWGLITGPAGEIVGVHSLSDGEPLKKGNFDLVDKHFEGSMKYSDWVFMVLPG
jgi:type II secretory pathway pseudopilin PulG